MCTPRAGVSAVARLLSTTAAASTKSTTDEREALRALIEASTARRLPKRVPESAHVMAFLRLQSADENGFTPLMIAAAREVRMSVVLAHSNLVPLA